MAASKLEHLNCNFSIDERCRICLKITASHYSLHETVPIREDDVLISKILIDCGNIEVLHDDRKPQNACFTCIQNAVGAYRFKMLCIESDQTLNTEIFHETIGEPDPLESKKQEEDIIEVIDVDICIDKEEQLNLNNAEVCCVESDDPLNECDPLKFTKEEDIIDITDVEIVNIKEEEPNLNNAEVSSEESSDSFNEDIEDSSDCFEDMDEHEKSTNDEVENDAEETKINNCQCPQCGKVFSYRSQMLQHSRMHVKTKCRYCNFEAERRGLAIHMYNVHNDEKTLKCHSCDKLFFSQENLRSHIISHIGSKHFLCLVCGETFENGVLLRSHMLRHSRDRPHACTLCTKKFWTKVDYDTHMNIHTKQRLFKCTTCSKEFTRKSFLKRHMLTHTETRPHVCKMCKRAFRLEYHLRLHINYKHSDA